MKKHFSIDLRDEKRISFLPPSDWPDNHAVMTIHYKHVMAHVIFGPDDAVSLGLLHRAIGELLDAYCPGIIHPLPDGDPQIVEAMKVFHEIDRLYREGNAE